MVVIIAFIISFFFSSHDWRENKIVNTITISGKGEVIVKPDMATVSFGVFAENMDVSKAQTESAEKINKIIGFLQEKGIDEKDIKTTNYSIYPRYTYVQLQVYPYGGKQVLVGYNVSQTVELKIRDISVAGEILSGIGEFGATDVSGLNFIVDNEDEINDQARDLAIQDARTQAKVLAKSLGVRLVKIVNFSENGDYPVYYGMEKAMAVGGGMADSVAPQIPAGENTITSNVSITYEIR